jgi:hypothetical protein
MSSLAKLAHAAVPAPPAFNGLFYATAATIIPVLFLALAVQGPAYQRVFRAGMVTFAGVTADGRRRTVLARTVNFVAAYLLATLISATLFAGAAGELIAIYALYQQHDQATTRQKVLLSAMFLVIATTAVPLILGYTIARADRGPIPGARRQHAHDAVARRQPPRNSIPPPLPKWAKRAQRVDSAENPRGAYTRTRGSALFR